MNGLLKRSAGLLKKSGPFGRDCPPDWNFVLSPCETIKQVIVHGGFIVDGIDFVIADECGKVTPETFGGQGGNRYEITLKPDEFITHISGTYGVYSYSAQLQIATIKIHTNCCPNGYGPYGKGMSVSKVCSFSSTKQQGGRLVGFFGSGGKYLDSIGVYIDENNIKKSGPWGSQSPTNWELKLGRDETIKQVNIRAGFIVDGIGFVIADSSFTVTTKYFGGNGGNSYTVTLNPNEIIKYITGTYGLYKYTGQQQIATIKIHTNYCPNGYGPFGEETGVSNVQSFSTASPCHVAAGFFGRANQYLDSIGAYMKPYKC